MTYRETTRDECGCWRETSLDPADTLAMGLCKEHAREAEAAWKPGIVAQDWDLRLRLAGPPPSEVLALIGEVMANRLHLRTEAEIEEWASRLAREAVGIRDGEEGQ